MAVFADGGVAYILRPVKHNHGIYQYIGVAHM
jgi:hypothetical protein